ncbi:MAG: hypothetical protein HOM25_14640 [Rhodospirillaceae bacterium]|jgi:hypothetical protein|nr:hypothetical protein [Rhodospirillaceae bacterium]MBT5665798.1 hypothetical protein [Rhodospirillaceae bacterium]MBT5810994.1 hypothetical protein [Rhodospirillaceae bacterium]
MLKRLAVVAAMLAGLGGYGASVHAANDAAIYGNVTVDRNSKGGAGLNTIEINGWNGILFGKTVTEVEKTVRGLELEKIDANTVYNRYWKLDFNSVPDAVLVVDFDVENKSYQLTIIKEYFPDQRFTKSEDVENINNITDIRNIRNIQNALKGKYGKPSFDKKLANGNIEKSSWMFKNGYIYISVDPRYFVMTYGLKKGEHYEHMREEFSE